MAAACDKAPNTSNGSSNDPNKQGSTSTTQVKSYRFQSTAEQCDTYNRVLQSQMEMCYAIQVDELNNNCAEAERLAFFAQNCANLVKLNETQARERVLNTDGNSVECTLSESNSPQIRQFTGNRKMVMEHTFTRAVVFHTVQSGQISLLMSLIDINTNREITRIQKNWQDEAEPLTLSASSVTGSPVLKCLVSLAENPNRE